jgi:hypothetical protein
MAESSNGHGWEGKATGQVHRRLVAWHREWPAMLLQGMSALSRIRQRPPANGIWPSRICSSSGPTAMALPALRSPT